MSLRKTLWPLLTLFALSTLAVTSWAKPEYEPGEVIVKFKDSATPAERSAIEQDLGMSGIKRMNLIRAQHGRVSGLTVEEAINRYKQHPKIEYIEPNFIYRASAVPNDPAFSQLWGLQNTGQTGGTPGADIRAVSAWSQFTGSSSVIVAIIDTGMDYNHVDLAANAFTNTNEIPNNNIDDDGNGFVDDYRGWDFANNDKDPIDDNGHGTHCSGTIGGVGNNGIGVAGVNWDVTLLPVKFLDASGSGSTAAAVSSIDYAVLMGARVINASWGGAGFSQALYDAIDAAGQAGVLFCAAAGNASTNTDIFPNYPSAYNLASIVAVAATDHNDHLAGFSNYGAVSVDLGAPGVDIYSTVPGGYGLLSGTSMATPHVAGAAGLIMGRFPGIDVQSAKNLMLNRVDVLPNLANVVLTGGRLNAFLPIADPDDTPPGPITDLGTNTLEGTRITLAWTATGDDGGVGTATTYQIRRSTAPITEANFAAATLVPQPAAPLPAGSPQSMIVRNLAFQTMYWFAIKAYDEFGNPSPISNLASGTTLQPPAISVSPTQMSADLLTDQQTTQVLTIANPGVSELNFSIKVIADPAAPGAAAGAAPVTARIVRTFTPTSASHAGHETPPPTYPLSPTPYSQGHSPARGPLGPGDVRVSNAFATGIRVAILQSGGTPSEIQSALLNFPDIAVVDIVDGTSVAPTLDVLTPYDAVIVANNTPFGDPVATGNVLADYVDQGGGVVMTLASFIATWDIRGRFLTEGYMPFNLGSGPLPGSTLGTFNAAHPIMTDVTTAFGDLLGAVTLAPGAELVASWQNGQPCVATKGSVAAVNVFVAQPGYWTGDIPLILHNALFWSGPGANWLSADPREGVVPAGGQLGVIVTFDATDLFGGDYSASLVVESDAPGGPVSVAAHLHVTGAPNIVIPGETVTVESVKTYAVAGAATTHDLAIAIPPAAGGSLELVADGDYGNPGEIATVTAEGLALGSAGQNGSDCLPATAKFPLSAAEMAGLVADGVVHVSVQNSSIVDVFCPVNQHTVRLHYALPAGQMDFGPLFVGAIGQRMFVIRNEGTDLLHVTSLASDNPAFTLDHSSIDLPPDAADTVRVSFTPVSPTTYQGTLTITSDDPDQPVLTIAVSGAGLLPPDIDVSPASLHADLLTGGTDTRTLLVRNTGLSDLTFDIDVTGPGVNVRIDPVPSVPVPIDVDKVTVGAPGSLDEPGPITSVAVPDGYLRASSAQVRMSGAQVLIVQDATPWGTFANQTILNAMGVAFDMMPSGSLATANLQGYRLIIIPSDQPTGYYATLNTQTAKLESFVAQGGVLEVHAAGWGWNGGDASLMTIPGGMHIVFRTAGTNVVLDPDHPLMVGIPNPFTGNSASHGFFTGIPAGATQIVADDTAQPNLVVYSIGGGLVVAGCQTFEYGHANGQAAGLILANMIPYSFRPGPKWLSASPESGQLPPGGTALVTVTFNATGLNGGDYTGNIEIHSNDPDEGNVVVISTLHVTGAPDMRVVANIQSVESTKSYNVSGAVTQHDLPITVPPTADATLELDVDGDYGDGSEAAAVSVEGIALGDAGRVGSDCFPAHGAFTIPAADLANIVADGVVHVTVTNTPTVDVFCTVNQHRVRLEYGGSISPMEFGSPFVGLCTTRQIEILNVGTDDLVISNVQVDHADFSVSPASLTLGPGARDTVVIRFCPQTATTIQGTLTILGNDPDQAQVTIALQGTGLTPPDIDVTPTALHEDLFSGQSRTRTLTVQNLGGSDLKIEVATQDSGATATVAVKTGSVRATPPAPARAALGTGAAALDEGGPLRSDQAPEGHLPAASPVHSMAGAKVLLVQDAAPWNTAANQTILNSLGIAFDLISSGMLAATDLSSYDLLIIPGDQPTSYYVGMTAQFAKIESFVNGGGVLELHAAGWGWSFGDASLLQVPGGLQIYNRYASTNTIVDLQHPIVAGVPSPFTGNSASHASFTNVPANSQVIVNDDLGTANLVVYPYGLGMVVASGQTLEWGYANNQAAGLILTNMIPFAYRPAPSWLTAGPAEATVPAGGSAEITVTFNATGLLGGDYLGEVRITSNDPDESDLSIPVSMHVTGAPHLVVSGPLQTKQSQKTFSTSGASTSHRLEIDANAAGSAELRLEIQGDYGDFSEFAAVSVEGLPVGELGRMGSDCVGAVNTFTIPAAAFAAIAADGFVDIFVQNSPSVDIFCPANLHKVTLGWRNSVDPMEFGGVFVGNSAGQTLQVSNQGTDALVVSGLTTSGAFAVPAAGFTLAPGGSQELTVTFSPTAPGDNTGTLTIAGNDPDGDFVVNLHGTGLTPADVAITGGPVVQNLMVGQTAHWTFGVANEGGSDLMVQIGLSLTGTPALASRDASAAVRGAPPQAIDVAAVRQRYAAFVQPEAVRTSLVPAKPPAATGASVRSAAGMLAAAGIQPTAIALFYDDFEVGDKGWTHQATGPDGVDQWALSTDRANSGARSWRVSQHAGSGSDALISPAISLTSPDATLQISHWYNFDDCAGDFFFEPDGALVEVREVGTATWTQVAPGGGYPYTLDVVCQNPLESRPAWSHDGQVGATFRTDYFDLTPWLGKTIQIRFHAGWDCGNCENNEGWYVDDVLVYSNAASWISVSPGSLQVPPGGSTSFDLTLDATSIGPGLYQSNVIVQSNDPDEPSLTIPVLLRVASVVANVDVDPNSLNLGSSGNYVTAAIELPAGHDLVDIVVASVTLNGVPPSPVAPVIGDEDLDGIQDLTLKFDRAEVSATLEEGDDVRIEVPGAFDGGSWFLAIDRIRVIRHHVTAPAAGDRLGGGSTYAIRWNVPAGWHPDNAELAYTVDDGRTWIPIASGVQGASHEWPVPEITAAKARVRVSLFAAGRLICHAVSGGTFTIQPGTTGTPGPPPPTRQLLMQNVPNPFRAGHATTIAYQLSTPSPVDLSVYSASGRLVRVLVHESAPAGRHQVTWNGRDREGRLVGPGVYFVQMKSASFKASRTIIMLN